jgi:hypothetical protein
MKNSDAVVELTGILAQDDEAAWVANLWEKYNNARQPKLEEWLEVDKYLFATDTTTTSNAKLPWTHKTTSPKLTQIRDNLHANYLSSLFPNDKWLSWMAHSKDAAKKEKANTILAYMDNKTREGNLRETVSRLLYDYIDKGIAFSTPTFEERYSVRNGEKVTDFVGPKAVRISPWDIVFNPTAVHFDQTDKVVRSHISLGALKKLATTSPDDANWVSAYERHMDAKVARSMNSKEDFHKAAQYNVDGFGSLHEYYGDNTVELLEFYGDYYDAEDDVLHVNKMITIVDRAFVARVIDIPTYSGRAAIRSVGWRLRPENLWAMGPLDNLVGMQYMIDHYLNMSANALDLKVMSPKKVVGDVEAFKWEPNSIIHMDENGDVVEMAQQFGDIYVVMDYISKLEERMEMYAGAPREAMGIRTPGEKTAFEMQSLENAAGRIFQEKIIQFELFLEEILNDMLETAHRHLEKTDIIRILDNDLGVQQFKSITKEDITANGVLRPVGARHFAQKSQELQNLTGVLNGPMGQMLAPHTSSIGLAEFIKDVIDLKGYTIFQKNIAISEGQETQGLAQQAEEDNIMASEASEEEAMMAQAMEGAPNAQ